MFASKIIVVSIAKPYPVVYGFLADPTNFPKWISSPEAGIRHLDGHDWLAELQGVGPRVIRFTPRNEFGILDYRSSAVGGEFGPVTPIRAYANAEGTDVALTWFKRDWMTDERFASDLVWLESDLMRLKSLLENEQNGDVVFDE